MKVRVLENKNGVITQDYSANHQAIDLIGINSNLDYVVAHSDGRVIIYQDGYDNLKGSSGNISYGNFIKLSHGNGYDTLYAHMQKGLLVKMGQFVKKGQRIGYMSDSGNAYGKHLHFEVWKNGIRINPNQYLDNDLYTNNNLIYKIGDIVTINGVYKTSMSENKLIPKVNVGTITKIINNAKNPYLLDNGYIGWINDSVIVNNKYLSNNNYTGNSLVEALNQINIDSSFSNRSRLAKINNINNYTGSASQNINLLNKLKSGTLRG